LRSLEQDLGLKVTFQIGDLGVAYLQDDFAKGCDSQIIDLVFVGVDLDNAYIGHLIQKAQELIDRKIRHMILTS
jgi:hypothetical protein